MSPWEPSWPPKMEPIGSKIDVEMASKFDHFLKASWNAIFSAKRRKGGMRSLRARVWERIWEKVWKRVWETVWENFWEKVGDRVWERIWRRVWERV